MRLRSSGIRGAIRWPVAWESASSWSSFLGHRLGRALDGTDDSQMGSTAAQILRERGTNLLLAGLAVGLQQGRGLHDHAVDAVAALGGLLVNERLLQRVRLSRRAQPFERHDLPAHRRGYRHRARAHRLAVDEYGA